MATFPSLLPALLPDSAQLDVKSLNFTDEAILMIAGDLRYLGPYRAWEEATLSDPDLARKDRRIHAWTTARALRLFEFLV